MVRDMILDIIRARQVSGVLVDDASHLYSDAGFESLGFVRLLIEIEEVCHISFGIDEMEACLHVGRLIELAERKMGVLRHDTQSIG